MRHRREYDKDVIGANLRRAREKKGLSVADVREYLQLGSVQAIYKYESGLSYPPADTLLALMELYDIDRIDLICGRIDQCAGLHNCADWNMIVDRREQMRIQMHVGRTERAAEKRAQTFSRYDAGLCM